MFLEDQRWPKRCGHMRGKDVIPQEEYTEKLSAAVQARQNDDFVIVARTDARATGGLGDAIERARQNVETGADAVFVEAPRSIDEMAQIGREINAPLVANMIEGGATPLIPSKTLGSMGFNIILYPLSVLYASTLAVMNILRDLRKDGTTSGSAQDLTSFDRFNAVVDLPKFVEMEGRYRYAKEE